MMEPINGKLLTYFVLILLQYSRAYGSRNLPTVVRVSGEANIP